MRNCWKGRVLRLLFTSETLLADGQEVRIFDRPVAGYLEYSRLTGG